MRFADYPEDGEVVCVCKTHPGCQTKLNYNDRNCWRCGCDDMACVRPPRAPRAMLIHVDQYRWHMKRRHERMLDGAANPE